jgi:hypothetical protein
MLKASCPPPSSEKNQSSAVSVNSRHVQREDS